MRIASLALIAGSAFAQFHDLTTNFDGSAVYFSSAARLRSETQNSYPKIFATDASAQTRLVLQQDPGASIGWTVSNFYELAEPELSDDGNVLAVTGSRPCGGGSGCLSVERNQATVMALATGVSRGYLGRITISRNGRWAALWGRTHLGGPNNTTRVDLTSEEKASSPRSYQVLGDWRPVIAKD